MPRREFYTFNDIQIPVDQAKIKTRWVCPFTKKVFSLKKSYAKHLRDYRENQIHRKIKRNQLLSKIASIRNNSESLDLAIESINEIGEKICQTLMHHSMMKSKFRYGSPEVIPPDFKFNITYIDLRYRSLISNKYKKPKEGVLNFSGYDTYPDGTPKPVGYSGFEGYVEAKSTAFHANDVLNTLGILTGTGGEGGEVAKYQCTLYLDDWPCLRNYVLENIITGSGSPEGAVIRSGKIYV